MSVFAAQQARRLIRMAYAQGEPIAALARAYQVDDRVIEGIVGAAESSTPSHAPRPPGPGPEARFTDQVLELAERLGWRRAHFRPARTATGWRTAVQGDGAGFPDLVLLRGSRLVVAELKSDTAPGPRPEQLAWLEAFEAAGAEAYVWRPAQLDEIAERLA